MSNINSNPNDVVINDNVREKIQDDKISQFVSALPFIKRPPLVNVIRLNGVIGKVGVRSGLNLEIMNEIIEKAFESPKLVAVCLLINSPGGSPAQAELIADRIITIADKKQVPVYSFVEDVAASGGYWLACAGDEIYALPSSIIGSIGVISSGFGFHNVLDKLGIERRVYTQGKNKSVLDPFQPAKSEDIKIINNIQKQIHEHFISYIKRRRRSKLTQSDDIIFTGEFWAGEMAEDFGLIDGIDSMHNFIGNKYGDNVKIQYVAAKQSWFKRKFSIKSSNFSRSSELSAEIVNEIDHKLYEYIMYDRFKI